MSEKLKPCPFCGGEAVYDRDWKDVQCRVCNARIANNFQRKKDAVEAWNTRPNPWHTGTPTEEGWYLIKYECLVEGRYKGKLTYRAVHIYYDKYGIYNEDGSIGHDEVWKPIEYQIIEQNKETD